MPLIADMIRALHASGAAPEAIAAAVEILERDQEAKDEARRAKSRAGNAERQKRWRERHHPVTPVTPLCNVTTRDEAPTEPNSLGNINNPPSGGDDNYARDPHRLPADFALSEADRQFARDLGWAGPEISDELAGFVDYWSNPKLPGSKALKTNWSATWRNRIRDLSKRRGHGARASPGNGQRSLALVPVNGNHAHVVREDRKPSPINSLFGRIEARAARKRERGSVGSG